MRYLDDQALISRLTHCAGLPSPSGIAVRIIDLCQQPDATLNEVSKIVGHDPAIASKMLRMANSPIYARQRKIENLRQAIALFGLNGTLTLALGFSLVNSSTASANGHFNIDQYWHHCLANAVYCQLLGKHSGVQDSEKLFLVGLVQDIGILALDKLDPELYKSLNGEYVSHAEVQQLEKSVIGTDHASVGAWLLHNWNFPEDITSITFASHDVIRESPRSDLDLNTTICQIASHFTECWWENRSDKTLTGPRRQARKFLGLSDDSLTSMINEAEHFINETVKLFELDPALRHHDDMIMGQAREVMELRQLHTLHKSERLKETAELLIEQTRILEEKNRRDHLTGLYNRNHLESTLAEEFAVAVENGFPLTVVFIDLDHFKDINDTYGHQIGDDVLFQCAKLLMSHTRGSDIVARYGGEEFVAVLPGTDQTGAEIVCSRILESMRKMAYKTPENKKVRITASVGIAALDKNNAFDNHDVLIRSADRALYLAKASGRDQIAVYR